MPLGDPLAAPRKAPSATCPESPPAAPRRLRWAAWLAPLTGLAALLWFLVRVIPKPSRAAYPCQRAAFPLASGFVLWLLGCLGGAAAWRLTRLSWRRGRYVLAGVLVAAGLAALGLGLGLSRTPARAWTPSDPPNQPLGTARGIFPGRVAWVYDPAATSWTAANGTYWWQDAYNDQTRIDALLAKSVCWLVGRQEGQEEQAWDDLFRHFNGGAPYAAGEKVAVKINANNTSAQNNSGNNLGNASPHMLLALLRQLVNQAHVAQSDITLYDASRCISNPIYNKCHGEFPDAHYADKSGGYGREAVVKDDNVAVWYSGQGADQPLYSGETRLPTCLTQAKYFINSGILKGHDLAGMTACTKNLFGSLWRNGSWSPSHLHYFCNVRDYGGYPARAMGTYNPLVDLLGHPHLGGKTLLFIVDALYAAPHQNSANVGKWSSAPFNNGWTSSVFVSQDGVALDSVALDFCAAEPTLAAAFNGNVDNWLHEAAQANDPPSGTFYDPDHDGTRLASLGVHEHWDSPATKRYSRNLGTGAGIQLIRAAAPSITAVTPAGFSAAGGAGTTLSGRDFSTAGTPAVTFGGTPATVVAVQSGTLVCVLPAHANPFPTLRLTVDVAATNPDAQSASHTFQYYADIEGNVYPQSTGGSGARPSIFDVGAERQFVSAARTPCRGLEFQKADCYPLATRGDGRLDIFDVGLLRNYVAGLALNATAGPAWYAPTITRLTPNLGPGSGRTPVTITGNYFETGGTVTFGGSGASDVVVVSPTQITCLTPPHAPGAVAVTASNAEGTAGSKASAFTYQEPGPGGTEGPGRAPK